jgi:hypothetical protein
MEGLRSVKKERGGRRGGREKKTLCAEKTSPGSVAARLPFAEREREKKREFCSWCKSWA